jgi:hypothetical protein
MGRPNLQSRCLPSFPIKFGGRGGGRGWEEDFFGAFPVSHYVPFKFSITSHHVFNMFPKFSMYSPTCLLWSNTFFFLLMCYFSLLKKLL